jgi:ApaG protein
VKETESSVDRSEVVTRGIRVEVQSVFVPERSDPDDSQWFFAYKVRITNEGGETAQLVSRHWVIVDGNGRVEEVRGPGVVGEQPVLRPGEAFEYTSACPLRTPNGSMHGTYQMVTSAGSRFDAEIAPFALGEPDTIH